MATTTTNGHAPMTELGRSGLLNYGGYIQDEHLRELQGDKWTRTVRVMQDHPIISGCLFAIEMLCRQVEWRIDPDPDAPPDDERVPFIEQCLMHDMEYTWPDTLSVILSMIPWGWSLLEVVYKLRQGDNADPTKASRYDDGRVGLRKLALRAQESRQRWEYDDHGGLVGMIQVAPPDYTGVLIPLDRALLFRTTVAKDNPEGHSAIRGAYESWYYATNLQRIEAIGIERDLAGIPVAGVPPELLGATKTPDQQAVYDAIDGIVTRLKRDEQAGVMWPLAYDANGNKLYELSLMTSGGQRQVNTHERIEAYKTDMAASLLADFIRLGHGQAGSWALSSDKTNLFAVALGAWLDSIAAVINTQLIPRLLRVNGWPTAMAPTLGHDDIEHVNLASLGTALAALADKGLIQYHPALEAWILRQAGAPEPPAPDAGDGDKQPGTPAPAVVDQAGTTPETPASTPPPAEPARAAAEPAPITAADIAATARWAQEVLSADAAALVRGDGA